MIICDDREFAFIHIPKCAGSSVRRSLRYIDTTGSAFFRIADHPLMGPVHLAHLTLADIAEHFPNVFDKIVRYRSMAIVRDPIERFHSAIFQRLREFKGLPQSEIHASTIEAEAEDVIAYLQRAHDRIDLEHVHFTRQSDFVEFEGKRLVSNIFALTDMDGAARHIRSLTGIDIGKEKRNRTTELSFRALRPLQRMLRDRYARLVPAGSRSRIRDRMVKAGLYQAVSKQAILQADSQAGRFVRKYYARDFEIVDECLKPPAAQAA